MLLRVLLKYRGFQTKKSYKGFLLAGEVGGFVVAEQNAMRILAALLLPL